MDGKQSRVAHATAGEASTGGLERCRHCGEGFTPARPLQKFCRPSCRLAHFKVDAQLRLPFGDPESDLFNVPFEVPATEARRGSTRR